jgi:hypothetical protein
VWCVIVRREQLGKERYELQGDVMVINSGRATVPTHPFGKACTRKQVELSECEPYSDVAGYMFYRYPLLLSTNRHVFCFCEM